MHNHHLHHHHRPPNMINDDQRSIGSIGYLAGNLNYNGEMFDGSANAYQLWKPQLLGEAPPPYDEVIGLSQSTADPQHQQPMGSNSCTTVSVATTTGHHRTLPLSICAVEDVSAAVVGDFQGFLPPVPQQQQQPSGTTNLINININNAGTITSVAAGENHQIQAGSTIVGGGGANSQITAINNSNMYNHHYSNMMIMTAAAMERNNTGGGGGAGSLSTATNTTTTMTSNGGPGNAMLNQQQHQSHSMGPANSMIHHQSHHHQQQQQQQFVSSAAGSHNHHSHHHHHHHKNANPNVRYTNGGGNNNCGSSLGHGQMAGMRQDFTVPYGTGEYLNNCGNGGPMDSGIHQITTYSHLSQSRDALNESNPNNSQQLIGGYPSAMMGNNNGDVPSVTSVDGMAMMANEQLFNSSQQMQQQQVIKQPVTKTNSDSGAMENNCSSTAAGRDFGAMEGSSRVYSSRDGKYNSRGQRLHRTIPRHFTTSIGSTDPSSSSSSKKEHRDFSSSTPSSGSSTLKRNKSEKAISTSSSGAQNKKPVCQCPIQHVPMTYMGTTTLSSNQLLASNVTGPTKLVSNHHHKSMLNVAKLTQQQQQQNQHQQMVIDPAKGYDDELKLMTNSLRRMKTKVPPMETGICLGAGGGGASAEGSSIGGQGGIMGGGKGIDSNVKIPTISKQVLNSDKEKAAEGHKEQMQQRGGGGQVGHDHHIHSILKHNPPSKSASRSSIVSSGGGCGGGVGTATGTESDIINPPPFPIELIDSLTVVSQQQISQQVSASSTLGTNTGNGATGGGVATKSDPQHPALPPKMHKSNRLGSVATLSGQSSNIHTISKSPRMSFPQCQFKGTTTAATVTGARNDEAKLFVVSSSSSSGTDGRALHNKVPSSPANFPAAVNHITYSLPKATSSSSNNSGAMNCGTGSSRSAGTTGRSSTLSEVLSKVPSVVTVPVPVPASSGKCNQAGHKETGHQSKSGGGSGGLNQQQQSMKTTKEQNEPLPGCSKSATTTTTIEPSHYNHAQQQQHNHHHHHQPRTPAKNPQPGVVGDASADVTEKPLPVCTTSKNCSNPKEHFLPNDTSLDDDYLSECENCKSAHGSRYYLEEEVPESPQETMTLQRKMPEATEGEDQTYYRTSSTLPTNTKKNTVIKSREPWFSSIPASSSSEEEPNE